MSSPFVHHLNFLPEKETRATVGFSLNYFWILMILIVFAAGAGGFSLFQKRRISQMQSEIDSVTAENEQNKTTQLKMQQQKLSESARKAALGEPIFWSPLLKKLALKIPDTVKLSQLNATISNKRVLALRGNSSFLLPIFRLKDNFSTMKECSKPSLVSIDQAQGQNGEDQLSFQMECTLL